MDQFKNYPTWLVLVHILNDRDLYDRCLSLNLDYPDLNDFSYALECLILDLVPSMGGLAGDLLDHVVGSIDWYEIVESIREDYPIN